MTPINDTAISFVNSLSKEDAYRYLTAVKRVNQTGRKVTIIIQDKTYILKKV